MDRGTMSRGNMHNSGRSCYVKVFLLFTFEKNNEVRRHNVFRESNKDMNFKQLRDNGEQIPVSKLLNVFFLKQNDQKKITVGYWICVASSKIE